MKTAESPPKAAAGKYLTFTLAGEHYAVPVAHVCEIIRLCPITSLPRMARHVRGVINLRGKIVPVVDLRLRFHASAPENTPRTCIIVAQLATGPSTQRIGAIVDTVEEVVTFSAGQLVPAPDFGPALDTRCVIAVANVRDTLFTILDVEPALDLAAAAGAAADAPFAEPVAAEPQA